MLFTMNRRRFLQATAATGLVASQGVVSAWAAEPLKIGFVYVGPIGDYGWTHGHDLGRKAVEAKFGNKVKTTYVESVAEGPDAERVIALLEDLENVPDISAIMQIIGQTKMEIGHGSAAPSGTSIAEV